MNAHNYGPIPASNDRLIKEETEHVIDYLDRMLGLGIYHVSTYPYTARHAANRETPNEAFSYGSHLPGIARYRVRDVFRDERI